MTIPKVPTTTRGGSRLYQVHDGEQVRELVGVTSVLAMKAKPALKYWDLAQYAEEVHAQRDILTHLDADETKDLMRGAPKRALKEAGRIGTEVHAIAEALDRNEPVDDVDVDIVHPVRGLLQYRRAFRPEPVEIEVTVANLTLGYAGTLDAIVRIGTGHWLLDYKTSRSIYADYAIQLAAYANAEVVVDPDGSHRPMPRIDGALAVHLPKSSDVRWSVRVVDAGPKQFEVFKSLLTMWRWDDEQAKKVIGGPIRDPEHLPPPY